jgi:hypothetical protein
MKEREKVSKKDRWIEKNDYRDMKRGREINKERKEEELSTQRQTQSNI